MLLKVPPPPPMPDVVAHQDPSGRLARVRAIVSLAALTSAQWCSSFCVSVGGLPMIPRSRRAWVLLLWKGFARSKADLLCSSCGQVSPRACEARAHSL